jgi:hypothetical protein
MSRNKLSPEAKELFLSYCDNQDYHSILNITYKDVAEKVIGWLNKQNDEIWNEVIRILEIEILASKDKCFTGKLSRLVSCLDGFHPGVRIKIATSDQISNRILMEINKGKSENLDNENIIKNVKNSLIELEIEPEQIEIWLVNVRESLE